MHNEAQLPMCRPPAPKRSRLRGGGCARASKYPRLRKNGQKNKQIVKRAHGTSRSGKSSSGGKENVKKIKKKHKERNRKSRGKIGGAAHVPSQQVPPKKTARLR